MEVDIVSKLLTLSRFEFTRSEIINHIIILCNLPFDSRSWELWRDRNLAAFITTLRYLDYVIEENREVTTNDL